MDAFLFPVDVRSSVIYSRTKLMRDNVVFWFHATAPTADYVEIGITANNDEFE